MSVNDAAYQLKISPQSVKRWISNGKLNGEKIKGKWFVIPDAQFEHHLGHKLETNEHHLNIEANLQREIISKLEKQIEIKDQQIDHITQLLAVQTKTNASLTDRLQVIEDMRHRPWWRFWRQ